MNWAGYASVSPLERAAMVDLYVALTNNGTSSLMANAAGWANATKGADPCAPVVWSGVGCCTNSTCVK